MSGLLAWAVSTICWLYVLRAAPLSRAYGLTSLTYVLIFLASVLNWAVEENLLPKNPIRGYDRPKTAKPQRPVATSPRPAL